MDETFEFEFAGLIIILGCCRVSVIAGKYHAKGFSRYLLQKFGLHRVADRLS